MKIRTILSAAALAGSLLAIGCEDSYDNNRNPAGTVRSTPSTTSPRTTPTPPTTNPGATNPDNTLPPSSTTPPATPPSDTTPDHPDMTPSTPPPNPTPPGTGGDSGTGTSPGK